MADSMDYLSPDFDLNTLTVPRLRAILVNHDVSYPASAKKSQLIRILEDEVLPQAKKLIRDRERVKRTSDGITDMGSRASSVASSFDGYQDYHEGADRDSMPPPPTPSSVSTTGARRARSTRGTRASTADVDEHNIPATPATASRRSVARSQSRTSHRTDRNDEGVATPVARKDMATPRQSTVKKLRRSEMTPSTEPELPMPRQPSIKPEPVDHGIFTYDNPFQSGSSPATWEQQKLRSASRKSKSRVSESPSKDGLRARKSETPIKQEDESFASTRSPFKVSAPRLEPYQEEPEEEGYNDEESDFDAGEEFTPEEQLALEYEQADRMYAAPTQPSRRKRKQSKASKAAPWVVILSLLSGFAGWWRKEKVEIGFCGIGKPTWSLAETKVPEWANVLEPQCEPCPPHAFCYPNFEARCEHDFILTSHPLSLGGLIPLPPTCEPDSEKARRVKAVADKAVEELRDRRAKWECGELAADGREAKSPEINEHDLKREIGNRRRKGMSDTEFDDLWLGALGEVIGKEEVVAKTQQPSGALTLSSTAFTRLPLTCAFRRHLRLSLLAYRLPLSILILCVGAFIYIRSRILARRSDMARVPELVATTLDRLATQAALHARGAAREPYIPIGQLRDDVLRSELQGRRREDLWRRVRNVVEGNANIRAAVREGRGGDVARVWEWIGGISSVSGRRESNKQFPVSPDSGNINNEGQNDQHQTEKQASGVGASRTWNEGRPIY